MAPRRSNSNVCEIKHKTSYLPELSSVKKYESAYDRRIKSIKNINNRRLPKRNNRNEPSFDQSDTFLLNIKNMKLN